MTSVGVAATQPVSAVDPEEAGPPPRSRRGRSIGRRVARSSLAIVIILVAAYYLFEGPVASLWYQNRQHSLASDFDKARLKVPAGHADAVLQIPTIDLNLTVVQGDTPALLRGGPGHRRGTPEPGQAGNSVVLGHATAWGGPFKELHTLRAGDGVYVEDHTKQTYLYVITSVKDVSSGSPTPFEPTTGSRLTLVTGEGHGPSGRVVITAVSGRIGHPTKGSPRLSAAVPTGSLIFNRTVLSFLLRSALAVGVVLGLRRWHQPGTVALLASPLVLAALLALLLEVDLFLAPLR
jgi:sortase A